MSDERKSSRIIVSVKLTKEELARIERCARNHGLSRHAYMKECLLSEHDLPLDALSAAPALKAMQTLASKFDERARMAPESEARRIEDCYQILLQMREEVLRSAGRRT